MTEAKKRQQDHNQFPSINKSASNRNTDVFSEFESNRRVLRDDKDNLPKMKVPPSKKHNPADEEDDYNEDFQPAQNQSGLSGNKKAENNNFPKKIQKKQQSNHKLVLERTTNEKNPPERRGAKSAMQTSGENINQQMGRYEMEVDKKFCNFSIQSCTNDFLNKNSEQIREYIKKYNEILTELINKNLAELTNKKKKKVTPEEAIKVLQQQIKNNLKIEQIDIAELTRLTEYRDKLQEQENYSETNLEQQTSLLNMKIKQKKKEIYDMKLAVQNEGKKLVPSSNSTTHKSENQFDVTGTKEKLVNIRKEYEKNEEKINGLDARFNELNKKIEELGDLDKEADEMRTNSKKTEDKNKKHQEVKKKYDAAKAHVTKTDALWNAKSSVIAHQNDAIRLKIKNIELQVKNMEEEAKIIYEKSMKTLNTSKPKNELNQKNLDKILSEMSSYNQNLNQKQMSLSQMKMLTKKKTSIDQLSSHGLQPTEKTDTRENEKQVKTKSQQSQRNRVWKEQNIKKGNIQQNEAKLHESKTEKNSLRTTQAYGPQKESNHETKIQTAQKTDDQSKSQAKPKKFNFNKNRPNQEQKNDQIGNNPSQADQKKVQTKNLDRQTEGKDKVEQKPKQNSKKLIQQTKMTEEEEIKPKRFNLNLRDRKAKEESGGYMPSSETQQGAGSKEQKQKTNETNEVKEQEKPAFNLRRKREAENSRQNIDNEFMGQ